ncbi:hypothetical protein NLI96_g9617 [Meripilus lineatus]|uniref:Uncharacterized protein n=1 Tax=Meripilus lineatus TaxID=2056292 RepID=A0AAD5UWT1_9APHY|nr:hypothetical protein NLI96_g9617 [Physisporinus lineatus]
MAEFKFKSAFFPDVVRPLLHASDMPGTSTLLEYEGPCGDDRAICFTVSRVIENKEPKGGVYSRCLLGGRKGRCAPQCSMLEATLSPNQCPPILIHCPRGNKLLQVYHAQGLAGMMEVAAEAGVNTPTILYAHPFNHPFDLTHSTQDTNAQPLMEIWPRLCKTRKEAVIKELASVMLKLYRYNIGSICTTREVFKMGLPAKDNSRLSIPRYHQGRLASIPPLPASPTAASYLQSLANQMQILMRYAEKTPDKSYLHGMGPLTEEERKAICDTWAKLSDLVPYHCIPFYATKSLVGQPAADYATKLFLTERTGIHHDLDLPRLLVSFEGESVKIIVGSGWEYSYHAPHWSVSRMPSWLVPEYSGHWMPPFTKQERLDICDSIYEYIQKESRDWMLCYAFGIPNRYFEDCLKSFWTSRKSVERRLKLLEQFWCRNHFFPFPITEQGSVITVDHYRQWCRQYYLNHPTKFMAIQDIWGNLVALPSGTILTHALPHQAGTSGHTQDHGPKEPLVGPPEDATCALW